MTRNWSIFTKPWKNATPDELGQLVKGWGFNAIEFPLRAGYQVEPENAERDLPLLQKTLGQYGVKITSVASGTDESIFAACQAAGVPLIRIMAFADRNLGYRKSMDNLRAHLHTLEPLCDKYGVKVGVQQHYGFAVFNTMEMHDLLADFDPAQIGAVWDAAHSMLSGEEPEQALDIIWDKLVLINFKAAYYRRVNGPEADEAEFKPYFTTGRNGAVSWKRAVDEILRRGWTGDICMPAEYTDEPGVEKYIAEDVAYLKRLFGE